MSLQVPIIDKSNLSDFQQKQLIETGFTGIKQARENGFSFDEDGNLIIYNRSLETGENILYDKAINHKLATRNSNLVEPIYKEVYNTRLSPSNIAKLQSETTKKVGKYRFAYGQNGLYFSNSIINTYKSESNTDTLEIFIQEGAKKAAAMSLHNLNAIAPNGACQMALFVPQSVARV